MSHVNPTTFIVGLLIFCSHLYANPENPKVHEKRIELKERAIKGNVEAMFQLGNMYRLNKNDSLAESWFTRAAKKGHRESMIKLANMAYHKDPRNVDYKLLEWAYLKLRHLGLSEYVTKLAMLYSKPDTPLFDKNKTLLFFEEAKTAKNPKAFLEMGRLFLSNDPFKADHNRAMRLFKQAADYENIEAMHLLGHCYHYGLGIDKNLKAAWEWYDKAAQRGYSDSLFTIAEALYIGKEIKKDTEKATRYYKHAAKRGHHLAKLKLKLLNIEIEE
jgi:uncharacterized protein